MDYILMAVIVMLSSFFGTTMALAARGEKVQKAPPVNLNPVKAISEHVGKKRKEAQVKEQENVHRSWLYEDELEDGING